MRVHEHSSFTTGSLRGWGVSHYGGLPPGWSFIRLVFREAGLSSGWLLMRAVSWEGVFLFVGVVFHEVGA